MIQAIAFQLCRDVALAAVEPRDIERATTKDGDVGWAVLFEIERGLRSGSPLGISLAQGSGRFM